MLEPPNLGYFFSGDDDPGKMDLRVIAVSGAGSRAAGTLMAADVGRLFFSFCWGDLISTTHFTSRIVVTF